MSIDWSERPNKVIRPAVKRRYMPIHTRSQVDTAYSQSPSDKTRCNNYWQAVAAKKNEE